jgi:hypothetical protein
MRTTFTEQQPELVNQSQTIPVARDLPYSIRPPNSTTEPGVFPVRFLQTRDGNRVPTGLVASAEEHEQTDAEKAAAAELLRGRSGGTKNFLPAINGRGGKGNPRPTTTPSWFGATQHVGFISSAKSDYASPFYVTELKAEV